ncbi:hypothetical protein SLS62_000567 [Diatrype stigma]|uniref:Nephrocystin 3-like N-terminal domain-containing protein n=1 Tax=Diatrype stigma TaxID=117547 RepID=A0AAN9V357_9PEZI
MEVVGFAASILTFIDISYKIVRGTYEIKNAASGATLENAHVGIVTQDLEEVASRLQGLHGHPQQVSDCQLVEISKGCHVLSQELMALLRKIQAKDGSRRESFKAAWAAMQSQSDVKKMKERLDQYRSEITLRLLFLLCTGDSVLKRQLEDIRRDSDMVGNQNARALENLQYQLGDTLRELQARAREMEDRDKDVADNIHYLVSQSTRGSDGMDRVDSTLVTESPTEGSSEDAYRRLGEKLDEIKTFMGKMPCENRLLHRLCFRSIRYREGAIRDPVADTYRWMLKPPPSPTFGKFEDHHTYREVLHRQPSVARFQSFLTGDTESSGSQTFFISGRPGCGKSTLMKFLGHSKLGTNMLETWAGNRKLAVVCMYFWSSDDPLQKSINGFYRAILYHTLKQCPELIDVVFPDSSGEVLFPDDAEFQTAELEAAFSRLAELKHSETHRFCYFIDGLDEYDGDTLEHRNLAQKLVDWANSKAVKIICSARPHTVFLDVFKPMGTTIQLHTLTRSDIKNFAESQFEASLSAPKLAESKETCFSITEDIVDRADGVFLWASLVVRTLINSALEYESSEGQGRFVSLEPAML